MPGSSASCSPSGRRQLPYREKTVRRHIIAVARSEEAPLDLVVLAVKIAAIGLVVYGGCLCLWHRLTERSSDARAQRTARNLRLINEMGEEAANEPLKKAA